MSDILAAMRPDMTIARFMDALDITDVECHDRLRAAGRAINAASNAAQEWRVVDGAPSRDNVVWRFGPLTGWHAYNSAGLGPVASVCHHASEPNVWVEQPAFRPTWCRASRRWLWSTAAHDPRPCGWPRPFASRSKEQR